MTITLNRLDRKNSITLAMYGAMADAMAAADADPAVRVVVLQGHETVFSAGNDIGDFLNQPPASMDSPAFRFLRGICRSFPSRWWPRCAARPWASAPPCCSIATWSTPGDNAAFSMPFVNLGLCPEAASSLLVPQMLGYHRAAEALLLGEPFMAEAALEVGLVNRVVPPTEANAVAQAAAHKLAAKPLSALVETKRLMKQGQQQRVLQQMADEGAVFSRLLVEPAAREAFTAFMEKRKPDFSKL